MVDILQISCLHPDDLVTIHPLQYLDGHDMLAKIALPLPEQVPNIFRAVAVHLVVAGLHHHVVILVLEHYIVEPIPRVFVHVLEHQDAIALYYVAELGYVHEMGEGGDYFDEVLFGDFEEESVEAFGETVRGVSRGIGIVDGKGGDGFKGIVLQFLSLGTASHVAN